MKKNIFILFFILSGDFIFCGSAICIETRNPFKDWFPVIQIEEVEEQRPVKEEKLFDVSLYHLDGVVWGEYSSKAIINNRIYNIGDKLDEAEIVKIDKAGVTLNFEDKEYIIRTKNVAIEENDVTIEEKDEGVDNEESKEK